MTLHEYAFDVKLFAVVKVKAGTEARARIILQEALDGIYPDGAIDHLYVTSVSITTDDSEPDLFEVDGEPT